MASWEIPELNGDFPWDNHQWMDDPLPDLIAWG